MSVTMLFVRFVASLAFSALAIFISVAFVRVWRDGHQAIRDRRLARAALDTSAATEVGK